MSDIVMPRLSDSMEEGTIVRWLVEDGQEVKTGEEIVEIETDKATMSYEADADGALRIVAAEGDTLPIGAVIASIGGQRAAPAPPASAPDAGSTNGAGAERVKASPVARRLARERGVELGALNGSGPGGRIVKADVLAAVEAPGAAAPA